MGTASDSRTNHRQSSDVLSRGLTSRLFLLTVTICFDYFEEERETVKLGCTRLVSLLLSSVNKYRQLLHSAADPILRENQVLMDPVGPESRS